MRTLNTRAFLAYVLAKYDSLMSDNFKAFLKKIILRIDENSEINDVFNDTVINLIYDLQEIGDYDDNTMNQFLRYIRSYENNKKKPCPSFI